MVQDRVAPDQRGKRKRRKGMDMGVRDDPRLPSSLSISISIFIPMALCRRGKTRQAAFTMRPPMRGIEEGWPNDG